MNDEVKGKVIDFVKKSGPVLPVQISKVMGDNILFAGAVLSELVANKKVLISNLKVGASPIYYTAEQKAKLVDYLKHLSQRPRQAAELLMEKKVLRDITVEPWQRVALREAKDFAVPLKVNLNNESEIFWRWYLLSNDEAAVLIKKELGIEEKKEVQEKIVPEKKEEKVIEKPKEIEKPKKIIEEVKPKVEKKDKGEFYDALLEYFRGNQIKVLKDDFIRKNREMEFVVRVGSPIGELEYFVVAKNKKKINDAEISLAYNKGQNLRLPVLFLSSGELTKKAETFIEKDMRGIVFRKV